VSRLETIEITCELTVSSEKSVAAVTAAGDEIRVSFQSLRDSLTFWRQFNRRRRSHFLRILPAFVERTEKTLSIDLDRDVLATLSPDQRGGLLEKAFGLWPLKIRWAVLGRGLVSGRRR
jgi:hypothetical protein